MLAPGTWPASMESGSSAGTGRSATSTRVMSNGVSAFDCPAISPVTTISSSRFTSAASLKSNTCSPAVSVSVCSPGRNPIIRERRWTV